MSGEGKAVAACGRRVAGMIHGFVGLPQLTPAAQDAIDFVAGEIRTAFAAGD